MTIDSENHIRVRHAYCYLTDPEDMRDPERFVYKIRKQRAIFLTQLERRLQAERQADPLPVANGTRNDRRFANT